jgi:hypothetical protein
MEVSGQFHAPATLLREKSPRYVLDRRLGGPQDRCNSFKDPVTRAIHVAQHDWMLVNNKWNMDVSGRGLF